MTNRINSGFTLIELMVVVVIIGILASVALPSYENYVRKGKRTEGKSAVLQAASTLERYYTVNNTYAGTTTQWGINAFSGQSTASSIYTLGISSADADGFIITATPANGFTDTKCGNLTYNQANSKGITGTGTVADCW